MVDVKQSSSKTDDQRESVELADVVRRFGSPYVARYGRLMMPSHTRALADIAACCTRELGGRLYRCADCQDTFWHYHCCRNRACPKCHGTQIRRWLEARGAELLPCDYFHVVATVPPELHAAFRRHQKTMYGLLMRVVAEAVKELCASKRHLGGLPGILSVLHTWNGQLGYHPHVHLLVTGGGISPDGQHWKPVHGEFLLPVAVLSRKIAAKFHDTLKAKLPDVFAQTPANIWQREWVSFCKHYGRGNDAVLNYLSRYVFRTAISNARILHVDQTHVTFRWRDRDRQAWRIERSPGLEFLRHFLQHVLPRGFHRVRYYGLWHSSKRSLSARAWVLLTLDTTVDAAKPISLQDILQVLHQQPGDWVAVTESGDEQLDCPRCPHCGGGRTRLLGEYPRGGVP